MRVLPINNYNYRSNYANINTIPSFAAHMDRDVFKKVKQEKQKEQKKSYDFQYEEFIKQSLKRDIDGNLPMYNASLEEMKEIHRALKGQPEVIAQIHKTPNNFGNLPMHVANVKKKKEIHRALKGQPEVIAQIHKTPNNFGDLPMHLGTLEDKIEIFSALKDQPEVIAEILLTPNKDCRLPGPFEERYERRKIVLPKIYDIATNSDVDLETSIKLLEVYKPNPEYKDAIETLKRQLKKQFVDNV